MKWVLVESGSDGVIVDNILVLPVSSSTVIFDGVFPGVMCLNKRLYIRDSLEGNTQTLLPPSKHSLFIMGFGEAVEIDFL